MDKFNNILYYKKIGEGHFGNIEYFLTEENNFYLLIFSNGNEKSITKHWFKDYPHIEKTSMILEETIGFLNRAPTIVTEGS